MAEARGGYVHGHVDSHAPATVERADEHTVLPTGADRVWVGRTRKRRTYVGLPAKADQRAVVAPGVHPCDHGHSRLRLGAVPELPHLLGRAHLEEPVGRLIPRGHVRERGVLRVHVLHQTEGGHVLGDLVHGEPAYRFAEVRVEAVEPSDRDEAEEGSPLVAVVVSNRRHRNPRRGVAGRVEASGDGDGQDDPAHARNLRGGDLRGLAALHRQDDLERPLGTPVLDRDVDGGARPPGTRAVDAYAEIVHLAPG